MMGRHAPRTHDTDDPDVCRVLHTTDPSQVSSGIRSPGAQKTDDMGLKISVVHSFLSLYMVTVSLFLSLYQAASGIFLFSYLSRRPDLRQELFGFKPPKLGAVGRTGGGTISAPFAEDFINLADAFFRVVGNSFIGTHGQTGHAAHTGIRVDFRHNGAFHELFFEQNGGHA
jgi:hypothetical protein